MGTYTWTDPKLTGIVPRCNSRLDFATFKGSRDFLRLSDKLEYEDTLKYEDGLKYDDDLKYEDHLNYKCACVAKCIFCKVHVL